MQRRQFQRVSEGTPVSAAQYNELLDAVESIWGILFVGGSMVEGPFGPVFIPKDDPQCEHVELAETLTAASETDSSNELVFSGSAWNDSAVDVPFVSVPHGGLWFQGEQHVVMRNTQANRMLMIPGVQLHLAVLDGTLSKNGSATASAWWVPASGLSDSEKNITVYDWMLPTGETLAAGTRIVVFQHRQSGRFFVIAAACEPE